MGLLHLVAADMGVADVVSVLPSPAMLFCTLP